MQLKKMISNFITNKGSRKSNQDAILIKSLENDNVIYLLADGMGGYKNGAYAANYIISNLFKILNNSENFDRETIQTAINQVTHALSIENDKQESKMGATLAGVIQSKEGLHCFWVGDVKIWHVKNGKIVFESKEHNLKNELIENNAFVEVVNARKYNHVVTRAIQNDIKKAKIDYELIDDFKQGDYILIASDGVTDVMSSHQLLNIVNTEKIVPKILSKLEYCLQNIAIDNYSLIALTV